MLPLARVMVFDHVRLLLRSASHHTGIPAVVLAAVALVLSIRFLRLGIRFAVEVAIALALLLAATRFGWVTW